MTIWVSGFLIGKFFAAQDRASDCVTLSEKSLPELQVAGVALLGDVGFFLPVTMSGFETRGERVVRKLGKTIIMDTTSMQPGTVVTQPGIYSCRLCKRAKEAIMDAVAQLACEKGIDTEAVEQFLVSRGLLCTSLERPTICTFKEGDLFDACPQHGAATEWTLDQGSWTRPQSHPRACSAIPFCGN